MRRASSYAATAAGPQRISPASSASRNAAATSGSNWVPAHCRISSAAASGRVTADMDDGRHRVERVGDREDASLEGDRGAGSTGRVTETVPALVMEEHVGDSGVKGRHSGDQPHALDRMRTDLGELALVEPTRLGEHLRADVDLPDVVERRAEAEGLEAFAVPPQPDGDDLRVRSHASGVRAERGVADLHGGRIGGESNHGMSGSPHASGTLPVDSVGRCECACPGSPRPANTGWP